MTTLRTRNIGSAQQTTQADALREGLVGKLRQRGDIRTDEVAAALQVVPRHLFAPGVPLETAYANDTVVTKRDEHGIAISSVSAPWLQATMLEQAQLGPGMRVLEIGSGGYNAALIAELVGPDGEVTTVDIDPDVVDRARLCLAEAGYPQVNVVRADAEDGVPEHAPYDRIVVTVGAWDVPPAWQDQLCDGGRLVVPLRMRGLTRSVAFEHAGGHLASRSYELCGFVPMQGAAGYRERLVLLHKDEVGLRLDDGQPADADLLRAALSQPRVEAWSGVTVGGYERFDDLDLWLATVLPGFCLLTAQRKAIERGLVSPSWNLGTPAVVDGGSFAYLAALRRVIPERAIFELGVHGHGPDAEKLADRVTEQIRTWDRDHRSGPGPRFEAYPAGTPDEQLPEGRVVDKRHIRLTVSWP